METKEKQTKISYETIIIDDKAESQKRVQGRMSLTYEDRIARPARVQAVGNLLKRSNSMGDPSRKRKTREDGMIDSEKTCKRREDCTAFMLIEAQEEIKNLIAYLRKIVEETPSTKREIKDISHRLARQAEVLTRSSIKQWLENHRWVKVEVPVYDTEVQTEPVRREGPEARDIETQTDITDDRAVAHADIGVQTDSNAWQKRNQNKAELELLLERREGFQDFEKVEKLDWPSEAFKVVKEVEGNSVWGTEERCTAFLLDREDTGLGRQLARRFPELAGNGEETGADLGHKCLIFEARIEGEGEAKEAGRQVVSKIGWGNLERAYRNIIKWREKLQELGVGRVAVPRPEKDHEVAKKMIEYSLRGTEIKVMWYTQKRKEGEMAKRATSATSGGGPIIKSIRRRNKDTDALLVTATGKSYAELLRTMKEKVDVAGLGIELQGVRSSRKGEVLLETKRGGKQGETLANEIRKCLGEDVQIKKAGGEKMTLHLRGIDGVTEKPEIIQSVQEVVGMESEHLEIRTLNPAFGGTKNATVITDGDTGRKLLESGTIKIGWTRCRITERREVVRCHRCWEMGHKINNCKGTDRRRACLKCAKDGHQVKDCKGEPFCPICEAEGHRADSMGCPKFRREVTKKNMESGSRRRRMETPGEQVPAMEGEIAGGSTEGTASLDVRSTCR